MRILLFQADILRTQRQSRLYHFKSCLTGPHKGHGGWGLRKIRPALSRWETHNPGLEKAWCWNHCTVVMDNTEKYVPKCSWNKKEAHVLLGRREGKVFQVEGSTCAKAQRHAKGCLSPCSVSWEGWEAELPWKQWAHLTPRSWFLVPFSDGRDWGSLGKWLISGPGQDINKMIQQHL